MSYTTILAIYPGEKIEEVLELNNAWGSAPFIWNAMAEKYLGKGAFSAGNELWALWKNPNIPLAYRKVHLMTFDRAYILKGDFLKAAEDIQIFLKDFGVNSDQVNHWGVIADLLETNPNYPAIGFHMTSVSENPFHGDWNDETEEYEQPNWSKCYSVYCSMKELESQS
ncbi:hypothetical protein [Acinetobacter rudis]|uniref:hypothetical protein n=1 Tax=Acinetobacter rudis TaxID=632955 RepID=UPI00334049F7